MDPLVLPASISALLHDWYTVALAPHKRRPYLNHNRVRNLLHCLHRETALANWRDLTQNRLRRYIAVRKFDTPRGHTLRPATLRRELQDLTNFIAFCEAEELTGPIRSAAIMELAPSTEWINPHALDELERHWLLPRALEIHKGGSPLYFFRLSSQGEVLGKKRAIVADWPKLAFSCLCQMGLCLGSRPDEALFAHRDEFSFGARPVWQLKSLPAREPKNAMAKTALLMPEACAQALKEYIKLYDPKGYLWARPDARKPGGMRAPYYDQIWRALGQESGLDGLNFRWLRHTYCTTLANRPDLTLQQVLELTRHLNPVTLQRYYKRRELLCPTTGQRVPLADCVAGNIQRDSA